MSLRDHYPIEMIDNCNANRCGCYFSTIDDNTCNHDCKASCLFTPGGRLEIQQCLTELCDCNIGQKDIPINDRHDDWRHYAHHGNSSHHNGTHNQTEHHNSTNSTLNDTDKHHGWENNHKRWRDYDNQKRHHNDMMSHHANHTNATNSTNSTHPSNVTKSVISMMGFVGYESYLTNGNTEVVPETDLPLISISITFAVFMVLVLTVYLILLRKEIQNEKKQPVLGYEDKNIYSEKLHFLENQEVCVSTL